MKQYGMNEATEFSKKQISVIYGAAKRGELKVEKWTISRFYDLADFYGRDWQKTIAREEQQILGILEAFFAGKMDEAQEKINNYTESIWATFTTKEQAKMSRQLVA